MPLPQMALRALTIRGSYVGSPGDLDRVLALAKTGSLAALPTSTVPKSRVNEALHLLRDGNVVGRMVLTSSG